MTASGWITIIWSTGESYEKTVFVKTVLTTLLYCSVLVHAIFWPLTLDVFNYNSFYVKRNTVLKPLINPMEVRFGVLVSLLITVINNICIPCTHSIIIVLHIFDCNYCLHILRHAMHACPVCIISCACFANRKHTRSTRLCNYETCSISNSINSCNRTWDLIRPD